MKKTVYRLFGIPVWSVTETGKDKPEDREVDLGSRSESMGFVRDDLPIFHRREGDTE